MELNEYVTVLQATQYVGHSFPWIYQRINDGTLKTVNFGPHRFITRESLIELKQKEDEKKAAKKIPAT